MNAEKLAVKTDPYLQTIYTTLEADYFSLPDDKKREFQTLFPIIIQSGKIDFSESSLAQLWAMEIYIIRSLTKDDLIRRVWIIREKFRLIAGESVFANYLENLPDRINNNTLKQSLSADDLNLLTEDAVNLIRQLQRMNYYRMERNHKINDKKAIPIIIFFILLIFGIVTISLSNLYEYGKNWQLLFLILEFGMVGAVISLIQRLEQASNTPPNFTDSSVHVTDIEYGMSFPYMMSLVVSGAVFSILVYLLSTSKLFNILDLLPAPENEGVCNAAAVESFVSNFFCATYSPSETAKLLILCFISGFAERFVPDVLDSLIRRTKT